MKEIKASRNFLKDLKKAGLLPELVDVLYHLQNGIPLAAKYRDHALSGSLAGFRDCHVKPDLVLIYRVMPDLLELHKLGSHSEVFG